MLITTGTTLRSLNNYSAGNQGMNAEPLVGRFQMEHQPRRLGYGKRSAVEGSQVEVSLVEDNLRPFLTSLGWLVSGRLDDDDWEAVP